MKQHCIQREILKYPLEMLIWIFLWDTRTAILRMLSKTNQKERNYSLITCCCQTLIQSKILIENMGKGRFLRKKNDKKRLPRKKLVFNLFYQINWNDKEWEFQDIKYQICSKKAFSFLGKKDKTKYKPLFLQTKKYWWKKI